MLRSFSWDGKKAAGNLRKHGVSFEEAASAFADSFSKRKYDPEHSFAEDRFLLVGMSERNRLLLVAHVERGDNEYRLISARLASRRERNWYEENE
jgi:uncharacterized protein